jgi:hypothetical protein
VWEGMKGLPRSSPEAKESHGLPFRMRTADHTNSAGVVECGGRERRVRNVHMHITHTDCGTAPRPSKIEIAKGDQ